MSNMKNKNFLLVFISFIFIFLFFFFFKQKTAYEIYQCDWSSDVCSSDLMVFFVKCEIEALVLTLREIPVAYLTV